MRLPVKFLPRKSQRTGNVVGAGAVILFGLLFMASYLPVRNPEEHKSFGAWLGGDSIQLFFLLVSVAVLLFGLVALTVALLNLLGDSPFNHLIVDRFGIRNRTFFGETQFSWKDLGPIRVKRLSPWRGFGMSRRFWIISDTFTGEERDDARRPLSTFNLRIAAASYLGDNWFGSGVGPATDATAAWLEALRQLARAERLESNEAPDAPEELGPGLPVARPAAVGAVAADMPRGNPVAVAPVAVDPAREPDLPAMEDRKFGRRDEPTVER
jgi:hypothetical protein